MKRVTHLAPCSHTWLAQEPRGCCRVWGGVRGWPCPSTASPGVPKHRGAQSPSPVLSAPQAQQGWTRCQQLPHHRKGLFWGCLDPVRDPWGCLGSSLCHWWSPRWVRNPSEGSLELLCTSCATNAQNATALCGFFSQVLQHLTCFLPFLKAPEEGGRLEEGEEEGGRRKTGAVCFLHRFTAPSPSHGTSGVLDMVSLHFSLLEGFPEPVAGESWCQWQLRTRGRAAAWANSRLLFVLFLAVRFILCPL